MPGALFPPLLLPTWLPTTTSLPRHRLNSPTWATLQHHATIGGGEKLQIFKGKPLQRREAWAGNHCQSWVEVHCRRRTSSPDSSPSWRTGGRWQPGFGTTVPTRWRWMVPAPVPPTRTAPWHRGTWKSSYHGCGWLGPETGRRQPRSRERRWTTRRGCRARQSCCGRRWCGGRSQWLARSPDPDFETCSDSCSASLPHCCTGLHWRVGGFGEPRQRLVVSSFSALCLDLYRSPPHLPTVDQQGGSGCAQRGAGAAGGDHPDPSLKASLAAEVAGAEAPVQFFRNFSGARECQTDLVILVVLARTLGVDERQSLLLGLQSTVITTVINCDQLQSTAINRESQSVISCDQLKSAVINRNQLYSPPQ